MTEVSRQESKKRFRRNGRIQKIIIWSIFSLALLVFIVVAYANMKVNQFFEEITTIDDEPVIIGEEPVDTKYTEAPFALVIAGIDSRTATGSLNTDVLIVAVVEPEKKGVSLISIPRDTAIIMPGYNGYHKVNAVYATGENARRLAEQKNQPITVTGASLLKQSLEGLLGIPIQHYVRIDFNGFVKVIDELDGIEVDVERRLVYHDPTDGTAINLEQGLQKLDGKKALDYVRHRHDDRGERYWSSDFDRNRRQQLVIAKLADKMKSFYGITKIFDVMDVAGEHIRTDLSKEKIKGLAGDFISVGSSAITTIETGADWNSRILKTVIPVENLEKIRADLWDKMGMSTEEGRARVIADNDLVVPKLTEEINRQNRERAERERLAEQAAAQNETPSVEGYPDGIVEEPQGDNTEPEQREDEVVAP